MYFCVAMNHPLLSSLRALVLTACLGGAVWGIVSFAPPKPRPVSQTTTQAKQLVVSQLIAVHLYVQDVVLPLAERTYATDSLQRAFLRLRRLYKQVEPVTAYYMASTHRLLNGPPLPDIEADELTAHAPGGIQVIEPMLFPRFDTTRRADLLRELRQIQTHLTSVRYLWYATNLTHTQLFDLLRLGTFRVATLGISGFDTPLCHAAIPEAAESLRGLQRLFEAYQTNTPAYRLLRRRFGAAIAYCQQHPDFEAFDRATFLRTYLNPLSAGLLDYQTALDIASPTAQRLLRPTARTLFAPDAFNAAFFAPTAAEYPTPARVALGKQLFADPVLSGSGLRSCASCHQPGRAFTDGLPRARPIGWAADTALRNTPTLLNVALQARLFADLRVGTLESQAFDVVHSQAEMGGSLTDAARNLQASPAYVVAFKRAFPASSGPITPAQIQNALGSYERSLVSLNSRFDRYMRGKNAALSAQEVRGFNVFMGKGQCGVCHFMPLFNGTIPPEFTKAESEVIGVPAHPDNQRLDPDAGRYVTAPMPELRYAFKTPTLRHIGQTAPYMHNGVYQTLEEVIDFYDRGGGAGLGFDVPNQTLSPDKLNLTAAERKALVAFLKAL
jgi:cytochrome c peroxidase